MTKDSTLIPEPLAEAGSRIDREVAVLLSEIEREDVPDRLLKLALDLQKALLGKVAETP
ncbi:hypothetical protein ACQKKX_00270 [Neorhizobium sp. NPDC001467]|uniref:hypothetical protein n=1 Tax=Neorhizobium sp. NPDC001467 TaxID=3390595 RepID=UPI003D07D51A